MSTRCDKVRVYIKNTVQYTDGKAAPIYVIAANPGSNSHFYTDSDGTTSVSDDVPITIEAGKTWTGYAKSGSGSGGWSEGTVTIQCPYGSSNDTAPPLESITLSYTCEPNAIAHNTFDPTLSDSVDDSRSPHFSATGSTAVDVDDDHDNNINFTVFNSST